MCISHRHVKPQSIRKLIDEIPSRMHEDASSTNLELLRRARNLVWNRKVKKPIWFWFPLQRRIVKAWPNEPLDLRIRYRKDNDMITPNLSLYDNKTFHRYNNTI